MIGGFDIKDLKKIYRTGKTRIGADDIRECVRILQLHN